MVSMRRLRRQPALAFLSIALVALAPGCRGPGQANDSANVSQPASGPAANLVDKVPLPEAAMDRAALLSAIAQAASAATLGQDDSVVQRALEGKPFELRIRFGCSGPAKDLDGSDFGWTYDAEKRVLRVRAMPTIAGKGPPLDSLVSGDFEAAEGFWLPSPWVLQAQCPAAPPQSQQDGKADEATTTDEPAPAPSFPRIGIAQFFTDTDSRTARRDGRAYEATTTLSADDSSAGERGFDLILSGRLRSTPRGPVIRCVAAVPNGPPDCIVGAKFDRVWIEQPQTRSLIAEWRSS
jgi:hypothetical protein